MPSANKQLIPLLLLAHACVGLVLLACAGNDTFQGSYEPYFMGLLMAQVPLVAIWLAWGRPLLFWRAVGMLGFICGISVVAAVTFRRSDPWELEAFLSGVSHMGGLAVVLAALVGTPLLLARAAGILLCHDADRDSIAEPPASAQRRQFSLWDILSLTTAVCLTLALALQADYAWLNLHAAAWLAVFAYGTAGCVIAFVVARDWRINLLWLTLVVVVEFALFKPLTPDDYRYGMLDSPVIHGQLFAAIGTAWVVRLAGYRVAWTKGWPTPQAARAKPQAFRAHAAAP